MVDEDGVDGVFEKAMKKSELEDATNEMFAAPKAPEAAPKPVVAEASVGAVVAKIDEAIATQKLPVLGAVVWWSFSNVEITVNDLQGLVKGAGLDPDIVPVPEARGALKDAIDSLNLKFRVGRHKVSAKKFAISLDLAELHQNGSPTVDVAYKVEQVIEYSFETKTLTFKTPFMKAEVEAAFAKYLVTLQSNDMRAVVMRALTTSNAITVRDRGGVYFVPAQHLDVVAKLKALCAGIKGSSLSRLHIADTVEDRADMLKTAGGAIEEELLEIETEIGAILADKDEKGNLKTREDTLQRRLLAFKKIREKAKAYSDLLSFKKDDVEARLDALQLKVVEVLS